MKIPIRRTLRTWLADRRVKQKYGTLTPSAIQLPGCDYMLEIDVNDKRARKILVRDGIRGKITKAARLWRELNTSFSPEILVDVGLNYGECLMGTSYSQTALLYGFEANPRVYECASRSKQNHPNQAQLNLFNILIAEEAGPDQSLYVDPFWSGTGTAIAGQIRSSTVTEYKMAVNALDNLIPADAVRAKRLLFKVDIEGYEPKALKGFVSSVELASEAVGLIEFDTRFLRLADIDPDEFLMQLGLVFHVFSCGDRKEIKLKSVKSIVDLPPARNEADRQHTDLLLIKRTADWRKNLPPHLSSQI